MSHSQLPSIPTDNDSNDTPSTSTALPPDQRLPSDSSGSNTPEQYHASTPPDPTKGAAVPTDVTQPATPAMPKQPTDPTPSHPAASPSASASMYESPSPPSSDAAQDYAYTPVPHRRVQTETTVVALPTDQGRPISPIHADVSLWPTSHYVPVIPDESTPLAAAASSSHTPCESVLSRSRGDLDRTSRLHTRDSARSRQATVRDRYILGCSILVVTSIVFVIIISGMTTMLANSNFPQLQILSDWSNDGVIPLKYGCHAIGGNAISFPLRWRNVPRAATNLVILFANAGAMLHDENDPVHWLVTDIPLNTGADYYVPPNASANPALMPSGAIQHRNMFSAMGAYWPPCAQQNGTSLFVIHAYAIEASPVIDNFRDAREVMNRFVGVPFAKLTGVYGQPIAPQKLHLPTPMLTRYQSARFEESQQQL